MYTSNESILEECIYERVADKIAYHPRFKGSSPDIWLGMSILYAVIIFVMLWVEVGYWPWWLFVVLWVTTQMSMLCTSVAMRLRGVQERSLAFDTVYWAHVTFSTHASVLGALHVLDAGPWGTLVCTTIIGFHLYAPHWHAVRTNTVVLGRWTGPCEIRFFATSFAIAFSPFHPLLHDTFYGSVFACCVASLLLIPTARHVLTTLDYETNRGTIALIFFHFFISALPSLGMAWWTWLDEWLATAVPVTFAGILVLINTEVIARTHFDRCYNNKTTVLTPLEFLPFIGVANAYARILVQPLSIVIIYAVAAIFTCIFLLRVALGRFNAGHPK